MLVEEILRFFSFLFIALVVFIARSMAVCHFTYLPRYLTLARMDRHLFSRSEFIQKEATSNYETMPNTESNGMDFLRDCGWLPELFSIVKSALRYIYLYNICQQMSFSFVIHIHC